MYFMKGEFFMKETRTLRMSFVDEGGKPWTLTISNPNENVGIEDVKVCLITSLVIGL